MIGKLKHYVASFRLRTLPLSLSGIFLAGFLAASRFEFHYLVFGLAVLTTLCLQILSNLANELGDLQKGTDNEKRLGPIRSVQSGALSVNEFYRVIVLFVLLSLFSGSALVYFAFSSLLDLKSVVMLLVGGTAVVAAIKYTVGKNAYGYRGLGDLFVFLFFGWVSTVGGYFVITQHVYATLLLPASSIGFLSAGVLNMNNIRDIENDSACGKRTIPVMLGVRGAKIYHFCLILTALICMSVYVALYVSGWGGYLFLLTLPLLALHLKRVYCCEGRALDNELRFLSLTTLAFALLAGVGQVL